MRWILGALLFFSVLATASAEILYKASLNNQTFWILGTIHAASHPDTKISDRSEQLIEDADAIYLELDPADLMQGGMLMMQAGLRDGDKLQDHLQKSTWSELKDVALSAQIPISALDNMQAWLAELVVLTQVMQQQGFSGQRGIESQIIAAARVHDRQIKGLETVAEQVEFLKFAQEQASEQEIIELLLSELDTLGEELDELEFMWREGDLAGLTDVVTEYLTDEMREVMLTARNARWVQFMLSNLSEEQVFIAVGAGHLGGNDGILHLLEESGAAISRVEN